MRNVPAALFLIPFLFVACAAAPEASVPQIEVQLLLPGEGPKGAFLWSAPLDRHPRLRSAQLGEVVVSGIWTVIFELDAADAAWLDALRREHGDVHMTWNGLRLIGGSSGYIMSMNGKAHAEQVLAQPPWSTVSTDSPR